MADEVFLVKQQTNLVKTWLAEGVEGVGGGGGADSTPPPPAPDNTIVGALLLTPRFMDIKYPKHIALCDTNSVILLIVIIMTHSFYLSPKKI